MEVTLELDPNGLLPVNGCPAHEELVYIQDFQDGKSFNIQTISWGHGYNGDGNLLGKWADLEPFNSGFISMGLDFWSLQAKSCLGDFSVCRLEAPFETNYQQPK